MATALKRTVYTRTSGAAVPAVREPADPALQRFLDAVWLTMFVVFNLTS